jgi:hypothetical protein
MLKSRSMRWAGHVVHMREMRNVYKIFVGKPKGKRPLTGPEYIWDNTKIDLGGTGLEGVKWIIWLRIGSNGRSLQTW